MKRYMLFLLLLLPIITFSQSVSLSFDIKNSSNDIIILKNNYWKTIDTIKNLEKMSNLNINEGFYYLNYGKKNIHLFVKPNYNLKIRFDANSFLQTLFFKGLGAKENNYLVAKDRLTENLPLEKRFYSYYVSLNEDDFLKQSNVILNQYKNLLSKYKKQLDDDFVFLETNTIKIDNAIRLAQYPAQKRAYTKNTTYKTSKKYPKYFKGIDLNNPILLKTYNYRTIVHIFYDEKAMVDFKNINDYFFLYQNLLRNANINTKIKEQVGLDNALVGVHYVDGIDAFSKLVIGNYSKKNKKQFIKEYQKAKTDKGRKSVDFNFKGIDNIYYSLKDFKGKYVYIDIWASWCSPCIAELPYLKKLKNGFSDKVHFISISWNDSFNHWKKTINRKKLKGVQLFSKNKNNTFFTFYNVNAIPRFILLDKKGNIIDSYAKSPSMSTLRKQLQKLK